MRTILGMMIAREKFHIRGRGRHHGFTLVELMVTVAVLLILLAVGVPQMQVFMQKRQVAADVDSLTAAIQLARSEALKRSGNVSICPLAANTTDCADSPKGGTTDWSHGWMIFIDEKDPDSATNPFDANLDTPLRVDERSRGGPIIYNAADGKLTFRANGLMSSVAGSFSVAPVNSDDAKLCVKLSLSRQGRIGKNACDPKKG